MSDKERIYFVDTNVLLKNPEFLSENKVYILPTVLREIESLELKRSNYDLQYSIRKAKRAIVTYNDNIYYWYESVDEKSMVESRIGYHSDYGDNIILAYVLQCIDVVNNGDLKHEDLRQFEPCMYTDDILLGIKCRQHGIATISSYEVMDNSDIYNGIYTLNYDYNNQEHCDLLSSMYLNQLDCESFGLLQNQYLEIYDINLQKVIQMFKYDGYDLIKIEKFPSIRNSFNKVTAKNQRQALAIDLLQNDRVKVKALSGVAGSGKDYLIFNDALQKQEEDDKKIIWVGNPVIAKGTQEIGFLPGTLEDKLKGNFMVLADIIGSEIMLNDMMLKEKISVEYVGNLRSRTFNNCYIIVGEAQNFTVEQLKLIIGRVGHDSVLVLNGDDDQADISNSGYRRFIETLKGNELFGAVELLEVERSDVAELSLLF